MLLHYPVDVSDSWCCSTVLPVPPVEVLVREMGCTTGGGVCRAFFLQEASGWLQPCHVAPGDFVRCVETSLFLSIQFTPVGLSLSAMTYKIGGSLCAHLEPFSRLCSIIYARQGKYISISQFSPWVFYGHLLPSFFPNEELFPAHCL